MNMPVWLAEYEPQVPIKMLVEEINKIYHAFGASNYDREHPEIHERLPVIWAEMIAQLPANRRWRVLDLGCGTGFEAKQVEQLLGDHLEELLAYDPSPEMLAQCKLRLKGSSKATFCCRIEDISARGPFNLLITNSLLHHVPSVQETIASVMPNLAADTFWLSGHEPSSRFYRNPACLSFLNDYSRHRRRAKWLEPSSYITKLTLTFGNHPLRETAKQAFKRGLFKRRPTPDTIDRIVDFHVARSVDEAAEGHGLDFQIMENELSPQWKLLWTKSYAYFGIFNPTRAPQRWQERGRELAIRFPNDGANFSTVWTRQT